MRLTNRGPKAGRFSLLLVQRSPHLNTIRVSFTSPSPHQIYCTIITPCRNYGQLPCLHLRYRAGQGQLYVYLLFSCAVVFANFRHHVGSFYYKIGACRHGDRCSRKHVKPSYSQTILLPNLYQNPAFDPKNKMNPSQLQNHFDAFYEDFFCEMCKYGEVEEVVVCDNNNDRMCLPTAGR